MSAVVIRHARRADAAAVAALSTHIWDGADYAPGRFAAWLADEDGRFFVAVAGGALAGFGKLSRLGPREWWLEGLRVHPGVRGQGVGRLLHSTGVALAEQLGAGTLRFSTASTTPATQRLAADTGFTQVGRYRVAWWDGQTEDGATAATRAPADVLAEDASWRRVSPAELPAFAAAISDPRAGTSNGLYLDGWRAREVLTCLDELLAGGRLLWWRDERGAAIVGWRGQQLRVNAFQVPARNLRGFLDDLARALAGAGVARSRVSPPSQLAAELDLSGSPWSLSLEFELLIYARPLTRGGGVA